jgi:hypothetical protein
MKTGRAFLQILACVLFALTTSVGLSQASSPASSNGTNGECVYPDPFKVLGTDIGNLSVGSLDKVEYRTFVIPHAELRWLLISFGGPPMGGAYVIACNGGVIARLPLGYFDRVTDGPVIDGHRTLEVLYIPASGSGIQEQSVALIQFSGNAISVLWDHASADISSAPYSLWGGRSGDSRWRTETTIYKWHYIESGLEIRVTGTRANTIVASTYRGHLSGVVHPLPPERYCFQSGVHKFLRC